MSLNLENHIFNFIHDPVNRNYYSEHTLNNYKLDLLKFLKFTNYTTEPIHSLEKRTCRQYLYKLQQDSLSKTSIHRHISSLKQFWNYLISNNYVKTNPWKQLTLPKIAKKLPDFLQTNAMIDFLNNIDNTTLVGQRNRMICEILYATGIRVSELTNMNIDDIDIENNHAKITGKRNKERLVIFADITASHIQNYLSSYRKTFKNDLTKNAFLINQKGHRLSVRSIQRIIKELSTKQGISKTITPHTLRHSFATDLFNGGADLSTVQELLGHSNVATTEIYTHVSEKTLFKSFHKNHPHGDKN